MDNLNGKVVLITGAGHGIGAATARALAQRGARLVLTNLDAGALMQVATELGADQVVEVTCDVCDLEAMEAAVAVASSASAASTWFSPTRGSPATARCWRSIRRASGA